MESAVVKLEKLTSDPEYSPSKQSKGKPRKKSTKGSKNTAGSRQNSSVRKAAPKQRGLYTTKLELIILVQFVNIIFIYKLGKIRCNSWKKYVCYVHNLRSPFIFSKNCVYCELKNNFG